MQQPIDFVIRAATEETAATLREYAERCWRSRESA
jgi:hypothetical protein